MKPKKRAGPGQVQVMVLMDESELAEFDKVVPRGQRSKVIRSLVSAYTAAHITTTDLHVTRRDI